MDISLLNRIKGFLDEEEGRKLYDTALEASKMGPCLEIGSYCGKSAVWLGTACRENAQVLFSIDHHRGSEEQQPGEEYFDPELFDPRTFHTDSFALFRQTLEMAGLEDTVIPIVCRSDLAARAWGTRLSLVFIDGGHSFATAFTDYNSGPDGISCRADICSSAMTFSQSEEGDRLRIRCISLPWPPSCLRNCPCAKLWAYSGAGAAGIFPSRVSCLDRCAIIVYLHQNQFRADLSEISGLLYFLSVPRKPEFSFSLCFAPRLFSV
ncbi:MAG: class I SAM-dependent methyltransferase [Desulfobacterales bacterium]